MKVCFSSYPNQHSHHKIDICTGIKASNIHKTITKHIQIFHWAKLVWISCHHCLLAEWSWPRITAWETMSHVAHLSWPKNKRVTTPCTEFLSNIFLYQNTRFLKRVKKWSHFFVCISQKIISSEPRDPQYLLMCCPSM